MYPENEPTSEVPPASVPAEPKRPWEIVLTVTPVILTVLGTILAGLSNSEMTLAQYFRTLASQSQSKVTDQWGFYQAKRIRGTTMEAILDLLPVNSRPGKVKYAGLLNALFRLQRRQDATQQTVVAFTAAMQKSKAELPAELNKVLAGWSKELERLGQNRCVQLQSLINTGVGSLAINEDVKRALTLVTENRWDDPETQVAKLPEGPITDAVAALRDGKSEAELAPIVQQITEADLRWAINAAETAARNQSASLTRTTRVIDQLEAAIADQLSRTYAFHEQLERYEDLIVSGDKLREAMPARITDALAKLQQSDSATMIAAEDVKNVFVGLARTFTSRRYKLEADYNQQIAYLYELEVRRDSQTADRHRIRSRHFFYGLLGAQAGVAISSLSLAARMKSVLWGLAGLAGLTALVFSLYVYLYV